MQRATLTGIRVRSPADARTIFHAVHLNIFPMVTRRLDTEERSYISSGSVYVWEERGPQAELTGVGIERWTDGTPPPSLTLNNSGVNHNPHRYSLGAVASARGNDQWYSEVCYASDRGFALQGFLFYHEKPSSQQLYADRSSVSYDPTRIVLIKQTYTVYVETAHGRRKWHLIAYFTEDTVNRLRTIDDIPQLASLHVPHGSYKSARSAKGRPDHIFASDSDNTGFSRLEYVPYMPQTSTSPSPSSPVSILPSTHHRKQEPLPTENMPQSSSSSLDENQLPRDVLVPLSYLQDQPVVRREPTDQILLKKLDSNYDRNGRPTVLWHQPIY
ncbi:hypothetical protein D9619_001471 [Psilocybe cf. subviscida]|uniref:Uncharacterized protein n=1 Tax=Psilocybe cf. subviscida TaxID=2480587 RepID=A0A8H5F2S7_9AGAR|nr:hypothetical protein D9619_001471 [Psilocybe cf. subviscida]